MKKIAILPILGMLAACAEQPSKIEASYVSSNAFRGQSCGDLMAERNQIVLEVNELTAQQKKAADTDAAMMGVGLILFWPAVLAVGMTDDKSEALAAAKGNYNAVTRQMAESGCPMPAEQLASAAAPAPKPAAQQAPAVQVASTAPAAPTTTTPSGNTGGSNFDYWSQL